LKADYIDINNFQSYYFAEFISLNWSLICLIYCFENNHRNWGRFYIR